MFATMAPGYGCSIFDGKEGHMGILFIATTLDQQPSADEMGFNQIGSTNLAMKRQVLFVSTQNSARCQMAEAFLNQLWGDAFEAHSAGVIPGKLNPTTVEVMHELGIDISRNKTKSVAELLQDGRRFDHVIALCDEFSAESSGLYSIIAPHLRWSFPDPADICDTPERTLARTRIIRDAIKAKVAAWCNQLAPALTGNNSARAISPANQRNRTD